ncbi:MAG: hypothetical protein R3C51_07415 [Parvularculaceae bacterium]
MSITNSPVDFSARAKPDCPPYLHPDDSIPDKLIRSYDKFVLALKENQFDEGKLHLSSMRR